MEKNIPNISYIYLSVSGDAGFFFRKKKHPIDLFEECMYTERESYACKSRVNV